MALFAVFVVVCGCDWMGGFAEVFIYWVALVVRVYLRDWNVCLVLCF